ncbi:MAG TPA: ABC transporter permease [Candidatus Sulfotelmatobacter sp.]|nr:ABC transporter permease [Candidatus Sulfotelmatobacter sp.]
MSSNRSSLVPRLLDNLIWVLLLVAAVAFSVLTDQFLTVNNLVNVLVHSSVLGIMVIGQSFTLVTANFDLSAESTLGLVAMVGAYLMAAAGEPSNGSGLMLHPAAAVVAMLALGLLIGVINGQLITRLRMNNFVVTLSMLIVVRGLAFLLTQGKTVTRLPGSFKVLGHGAIGPVPISVVILIAAFLVAAAITRSTRFGRDLYAVGGNRDAAVASGIDADRRVRQVYLISGALAAFAAWVELGRLGVGATRIGEGMIFEIQAAAVIGGISLFGGRGTMIGALGGVLLLSLINSGLNLMRVSGFAIDMVRGIVILAAMLIDAQKLRYRQPTARPGSATRLAA